MGKEKIKSYEDAVMAYVIKNHGEALASCIQDPVYHAEGSVWTHTVRVLEEVKKISSPSEMETMAVAAILHDIAKPGTREEYFDESMGRVRVSHKHHAKLGAIDAWNIMWKLGLPLQMRLDVYAIILWHQKVFHTFYKKKEKMEEEFVRFSIIGNWDQLIRFALADTRGRDNVNNDDTEDTLAALTEAVKEFGVFDYSYPFETPNHRITALESKNRFYVPIDPPGGVMHIMSGPPGSGKDTFIEKNLPYPVVSLDSVRGELGIKPDGNQGRVIQEAQKRVKEYLAAKETFVLNITGLRKETRDKWTTLARDYHAFISFHCMNTPYDKAVIQNTNRKDSVPQNAWDKMVSKWEPVTLEEGHFVEWV
jgi:hypothetical protein